MTAASAGGAPTSAAGTIPPPAAAQLPTDGVGLETDPPFEGNEKFYGEDLSGAGQVEEGNASEMAADACEEEREKRLHLVESAEKDTADKDGAAK